ncbi:hypothetical protein L195_g035945, partial [Trifolium pratense]
MKKQGIAKRLLKKALEKVAAKENTTFKELVSCNDRKRYHDDITVIVIFINQGKSLWKRNVPPKLLSYRVPPSSFLEPLKSIFAVHPSTLVGETEARVKPVKVKPVNDANRPIVINEPSPQGKKVPEVDLGKGKGAVVINDSKKKHRGPPPPPPRPT